MVIFIFSGCTRDSNLESYPTVHFSTDVLPILSSNCNQDVCHGNNSSQFSLTSYDNVLSKVNPGNGRKSKIYKAITGRSKIMPPSPATTLNDDQIRAVFVWIEQGAINN